MCDQAQNLRELVRRRQQQSIPPRVIAITSGKGGVGKSFFSVNLAIALQQLGLRVLVIDADFGLANIDIMLGAVSSHNFSHVLSGEKTLREIIQDGQHGVKFISGGSGLYDLLNLEESQLRRMLSDMNGLGDVADFVLVDTGAGINENIMQLIGASNEVIVITTPEPTALVDAYAMLKSITENGCSSSVSLVMNRVRSEHEAQNAIQSLTLIAARNINLAVRTLGYITSDPDISKTITLFTPLLIKYPNCIASRDIRFISEKIARADTSEAVQPKSNLRRFFAGFLK